VSLRVAVAYDEVVAWLKVYAATIAENKEYLTELDSAIGDADHGINMDRGFQAAVGTLDSATPGDIGALLKTVGMTLVSKVGGAGGPLYGTLFLQLGAATAGKERITPEDWSAALEGAVAGVQARGKAEPGDKTMLDALIPGVVREGKRAIWQLGQVNVLDAGPNGSGYGSGCPATCGDGDERTFLRQGIFIP